MITPAFDLSQDPEYLILCIRVPYTRTSEFDLFIDGTDFKFYAKPYFLRLSLPGQVVEDGREKAKFDIDKGLFTVWVPKETTGEHFEGLQMLTSLLAPKGARSAKPLIEDVSTGCSEGAGDADEDEEEFDWQVEQEEYKESSEEELGALQKYGFGNQRSGVFARLQEELTDVIDVKNPEGATAAERRRGRLEVEASDFSPDHYLADLFEDEEIKRLLKFSPWWAKLSPTEQEEAEEGRRESNRAARAPQGSSTGETLPITRGGSAVLWRGFQPARGLLAADEQPSVSSAETISRSLSFKHYGSPASLCMLRLSASIGSPGCRGQRSDRPQLSTGGLRSHARPSGPVGSGAEQASPIQLEELAAAALLRDSGSACRELKPDVMQQESPPSRASFPLQPESSFRSAASVSFTDGEKEQLRKFTNRSYLLDKASRNQVWLSLVDILLTYSYEVRSTEGEHNVESPWTIRKLSGTLCWLESQGSTYFRLRSGLKTYSSLQDVLVSFGRRVLCYPLYRHFSMVSTAVRDTTKILQSGKAGVLKCLLDIHKVFRENDPAYILNDLYITDYCTWIQRVK
ncbi:hypothetical protein JOQ06_014337 [Pogonophryne albipinna]|uniref:Protein SHQ1 homolog n=1 Tax=Pogonophryne albipinna TaxID=1090488 RepID=A0AAD6AKY3_9TELE|nr:hypothetical protein JOQ06_014337 [Pogonophryne albipinna]